MENKRKLSVNMYEENEIEELDCLDSQYADLKYWLLSNLYCSKKEIETILETNKEQ